MTREERIAAQRRACGLLGQLLDRCEHEGLPLLNWYVADHGLLTGRCVAGDHAERLGAFQAWTRALDLHLWPGESRSDGRIRLQAVQEGLAKDVDLSLIVVVDPEARP